MCGTILQKHPKTIVEHTKTKMDTYKPGAEPKKYLSKESSMSTGYNLGEYNPQKSFYTSAVQNMYNSFIRAASHLTPVSNYAPLI
ncbi:MAG: hypothetical protein NTZ83_00515 [Candidatus Pacearchaeota archaeon]|nr:hypothetical protein [Candidatus Pacearchaeota archaeon]